MTANRAKPIQREHIRQVRARKFVRDAIAAPHMFLAFDRAAGSARKHAREAARGLTRGTPDTLLLIPGRCLWAEWKDRGEKPDDDQLGVLADLRALGHDADWFDSIVAYHDWLLSLGVPLRRNARLLAEHYDLSADGVIAAAEQKRGVARKPARTKREPNFVAGKRVVARAAKAGVFFG